MRVLIADDEWLVAAALKKQMEGHGHEVIGTVGSGAEALGRCCQEGPDLVLMDLQMPEMDGIAATRAVMERRPTCVIIVTARADLEMEAEQAGAMSYVTKPLAGDRIPRVVEEAGRRFAQFLEVREEAKSLHDAMEAWCAVRRAVRDLAQRAGLSEEEVFAALQRNARKGGMTLHEAARTSPAGGFGRAAPLA